MPTAAGLTRKATWTTCLVALVVALAGCTSPTSQRDPDPQRPTSDAAPTTPRDERLEGTRPDTTPERDTRDVDSPKPAEEVSRWDVDLRRDERRGGHTIARHVGRTDAQLKARLERESISAASTYVDLESAERVVAAALAENERRVQRWIDQRSPKANLAIRYRARDDVPTGRLLRRGATASVDVTGAVVVLRWRGEDWYVLTAYPENPR